MAWPGAAHRQEKTGESIKPERPIRYNVTNRRGRELRGKSRGEKRRINGMRIACLCAGYRIRFLGGADTAAP